MSEEFPFEIKHDVCGEDLHPDYHPLTEEEIVDLLGFARDHEGNHYACAKVQVRLIQGMLGNTCPLSADEDVIMKRVILARVYVDNINNLKRGDVCVRIIARTLYSCMT